VSSTFALLCVMTWQYACTHLLPPVAVCLHALASSLHMLGYTALYTGRMQGLMAHITRAHRAGFRKQPWIGVDTYACICLPPSMVVRETLHCATKTYDGGKGAVFLGCVSLQRKHGHGHVLLIARQASTWVLSLAGRAHTPGRHIPPSSPPQWCAGGDPGP